LIWVASEADREIAQVFRDWAWSYLFSKRGSRLILSGDWRLEA
jgi:hypothetical protein